MADYLKTLIKTINKLDIWLKENPNVRLPKEEKQRLGTISMAILELGSLTEEELQQIQEKNKPNYVRCENCGVKLNAKNQSKHQKKCKKTATKGNTLANKSPQINNNDILDHDIYSEERRLDGSRDYWKIRDYLMAHLGLIQFMMIWMMNLTPKIPKDENQLLTVAIKT